MRTSEGPVSFKIPVLKVQQPIGAFFIGVMDAKRLCDVTDFDVRRLVKERDFETYLGIQRPLDKSRVKEIRDYVTHVDACFPTGVILSVRGECANYDDKEKTLTLSNYFDEEDSDRNVLYREIARVIDGQHRIEGLKEISNTTFEVNVSIFVEIDVAEEAYIFSTVNLAQTKVNRSLAIDLYELAKSRSPQKFCHNAAVVLDREKDSPLYHRIKRLGVATEGRFTETITQANFVDSLMRYVSKNPMRDRELYLRGGRPEKADKEESKKLIFRNMFIDERDLEIVDILWNYFSAVSDRWPSAWSSLEKGEMLNRTNGFRALMRFLLPAYQYVVQKIGDVPTKQEFGDLFRRIDMNEQEFRVSFYPPGTSGEATLYKAFRAKSGL